MLNNLIGFTTEAVFRQSVAIGVVAGLTLSAMPGGDVHAADRHSATKTNATKPKTIPKRTTIPRRVAPTPTAPTAPIVSRLLINSGDKFTSQRIVTLKSTVDSATHYRAGEGSPITQYPWKPYAAAVYFNLAAGNGMKSVLFQTKNAAGLTSSMRSDSITLMNPRVVSVSINKGAAETQNQTVAVKVALEGTATQYRASEDSIMAGAVWKTYKSEPLFQLSGAAGNKTIYFQARNGNDLSNQASDTIAFNVNTEHVVSAGSAYTYAAKHGFLFKGEGRPKSSFVSCTVKSVNSELKIDAASNVSALEGNFAPLSARCRFTLFDGKYLNPPWRIKKVDTQASGNSWEWHSPVHVNSDLPLFIIDINKPALATNDANVRIQTITLIGPADGAWQDAFK